MPRRPCLTPVLHGMYKKARQLQVPPLSAAMPRAKSILCPILEVRTTCQNIGSILSTTPPPFLRPGAHEALICAMSPSNSLTSVSKYGTRAPSPLSRPCSHSFKRALFSSASLLGRFWAPRDPALRSLSPRAVLVPGTVRSPRRSPPRDLLGFG